MGFGTKKEIAKRYYEVHPRVKWFLLEVVNKYY